MEDATAGWENFCVAQVGASAALTGLLFVAVSINLSRILQIPHLPGRAAESLIVLLAVLGVSSLGLVPHTSRHTLGIELVAVWSVTSVGIARSQLPDTRRRDPDAHWPSRLLTTHLPLAAFLGGGISLLAGAGGGMYWVLGGTLACFAASTLNAWVLLVEIQR
jgi:hypothetical protein